MFYLTTHSTHFIYGYMASHIWLRTILIVRKETRCSHIGYSYRLTARVLLYAPSFTQDNTYHGLCYTSRGALAGTRNSSMGSPHEGPIRRPITPWANALTHGTTSHSRSISIYIYILMTHSTRFKMVYISCWYAFFSVKIQWFTDRDWSQITCTSAMHFHHFATAASIMN